MAPDVSHILTFNMPSIRHLMYGTTILLQALLILIQFGKSRKDKKNIEVPLGMWPLLMVVVLLEMLESTTTNTLDIGSVIGYQLPPVYGIYWQNYDWVILTSKFMI